LLLELKSDLETRHSVSVQVFQGDLSRQGTVQDLLEILAALDPSPSILVNNAGRGLEERALGASPGLARQLMQLNLDAPLALTRGLLPAMTAARRGWILNISSIAGLVPLPGHALYSASKHALLAFGRALMVELAGSGVVVHTLCPGLVDTEFFAAGGLVFRPRRAAGPEEIARQGLDALARGSGVTVIPWGSRLWTWCFVRLPLALQHSVLAAASRRYLRLPARA
jgi:short-subunit dehydrogenase